MNYTLHYAALMLRARQRPKPDCYTEKHHITPKCMGGGDEPDNIAILTAEEHFVAHQLLVKMHPDHLGLIWAASAMCGSSRGHKRNNKLYGWLRRRFAQAQAEAQRGRTYSPESREKMARAKRGIKRGPHTAETKAKIARASGSRRHSDETKKKISVKKTGVPLGPMTEERKRRTSESMKRTAQTMDFAHLRTPTYRKGQSERMNQIWAARKAGGGS